jgi:O-antigen/teichoic acid export membrane protein
MSNLTKRFGLTFFSNILRQGSQLIVGFIVTPIVIRGLGAELYGAWQMIEQSMQYLARSDLRPLGTLRIFLSVRQHDEDIQEKRRLIGAALLVTMVMLPVILIGGAVLVWKSSSIIRVSPDYVWAVQITMAIAVLRVALDKLLGLPWSILAGMNLDYKSMGLNAATLLLGGVISVVAIKVGWGLPGVACAAVIGMIISGVVRFIVVKQNVPWFGVARPTKQELSGFGKSSGWLFLSGIADALLNVSDMLIVGTVLGPSAAAVYATTGAVLRMSSAPIASLLFSASSGIGELCGRNEWDRVLSVRSEMYMFSVVLMTIIGTGVVCLNKAFLVHWVGDGFYGGDVVNLLLVLVACTRALVATDSVLIDNLLVFKEKGMAMLLCGMISLAAGATLSYKFGVAGMAMAILISQFFLLVYFQKLMRTKLPEGKSMFGPEFSRLLLVSASLLVLAYNLRGVFTATTLTGFGFSGCIVLSVTVSALWLLGMSSDLKSVITSRLFRLLPAKKC